jgi:hypothetical protein
MQRTRNAARRPLEALEISEAKEGAYELLLANPGSRGGSVSSAGDTWTLTRLVQRLRVEVEGFARRHRYSPATAACARPSATAPTGVHVRKERMTGAPVPSAPESPRPESRSVIPSP